MIFENTHEVWSNPDPEIVFPDLQLEPGFLDLDTGRWTKPTSPAEAYVYKTVCHERILKYFPTPGDIYDLRLDLVAKLFLTLFAGLPIHRDVRRPTLDVFAR